MDINDHVDNLNDLIADFAKTEEDKVSDTIGEYCAKFDLDPYGFDVDFDHDSYFVTIGE